MAKYIPHPSTVPSLTPNNCINLYSIGWHKFKESCSTYTTTYTSPASVTLSTAPHRDNKFEMIHDQLVMGIRDSSLSVRLQTGAALTLEKAKTVIRQHKAVQEQQLILSHGDKSDQ